MPTQEQCFDQMLTITADLFFSIESELFKPYYEGNENNAMSILDVGCGNGAYLSLLSRQFPLWRCIGLERDERIYHYAQPKETANLTFIRTAYENYQSVEPFDYVIIRLVAAHLQDRTHFMHWLRNQTHPDSIIILIDVEDNMQANLNEAQQLPLFSELYRAMRRPLRTSKILSLKDSLLLEGEAAGFEALNAVSYGVQADSPDTRRQIYEYMQAVTGARCGSPLPPDRQLELNIWNAAEHASFGIGLFGLILSLKSRFK
jgi:SAM-dependent methyltransferase